MRTKSATLIRGGSEILDRDGGSLCPTPEAHLSGTKNPEPYGTCYLRPGTLKLQTGTKDRRQLSFIGLDTQDPYQNNKKETNRIDLAQTFYLWQDPRLEFMFPYQIETKAKFCPGKVPWETFF